MHHEPPRPLCGHSTIWRALRPGSPWIWGVCLPRRLEPHEVEWREAVMP